MIINGTKIRGGKFYGEQPKFPTIIGEAWGGGYYAGQYSSTANGVATHYLIVAPKASGEIATPWASAITFCDNLVTGGYSDWFLPNRSQLEICYYNLKPTTDSNNTAAGSNLYSVPQRGSLYTAGNPAQTSAIAFRSGGAEAFDVAYLYWSSQITYDPGRAYSRSFTDGTEYNSFTDLGWKGRAIRLIPV